MKRGVAAGVAVFCLAVGLAACSSGGEDLSEQYAASNEQGYVAGDGSTLSISAAKRTAPVEFSGTDEQGNKLANSDFVGSVTVVNFWYAGCAPCRAEAKDLARAANDFAEQGVKFLGVNTRDEAAQATQFAKEFDIPYPSIMDNAGGRSVQRAFAGQVPLNAVPTTLVLDVKGRVAHRILGQLAGYSQLATLLKETLAEGSK